MGGVRDALGAIRPDYFRLVIDWASLQPTADAPANFGAPHAGCMRATGPCLGWAGVRDQLRALASRQREGGWQALVVVTSTPDWAAAPAGGCERARAIPRSRPPRADALPAYGKLVADVLAAAARRARTCATGARGTSRTTRRSSAPSARRVTRRAERRARRLRGTGAGDDPELAEAPGDQQLVLGETAGLMKSTRLVTSVPEFIAGLPQDVVCASTRLDAARLHRRRGPGRAARRPRSPPRLPAAAHALDHRDRRGRRAARPLGGAGDHRRPGGLPRAPRAARPVVERPARHRRLPVHGPRGRHVPRPGWSSTDLTATRPALAEWTAWGGGRAPTAPPPPPPAKKS